MLVKKQVQILLVIVLSVSVGICIWQGYQLRAKEKKISQYTSQTMFTAVTRLNGVGTAIDSVNKNKWVGQDYRLSMLNWQTMTLESLQSTLSALSSGIIEIPNEQIQSISDLYYKYSVWHGKAVDILYKQGPLSTEEKEYLLKMSNVLSDIKSFLPTNWKDTNAPISYLMELDKKLVEFD
ncbi:hypothetical protein [Paenibacillus methanolicus]|uniref:Uncharacterized protein n=1 Tax=Paenibacillus methanolicus TaxID=582686 RepID=A0A5S5C789_9BACL|nr:hypothetical protein [Paenibacillus methanolicus]TYP74468.1 hypothetical protein BCM02_10512 [Paenibacillus methanolicus]